ncbi:MAG: NirD/YgiW/YdeI family stress tolerance protein [Treponema sp.]|nr:NirD/YgiW/YdeI family stress tolerance protein [Treponema sp.]
MSIVKCNRFVCFFLLLCVTVFVHAQGFTGPGTNVQPVMTGQPVTISEAKNYPHDSWVVITGNIVSVLPGGRHFIFRDSSGEIPVEIGPKEWRGLSAATSDDVEIYGEVKIERGQIFIKVHAINAATGPNVRRYAFTINEAQNLPHDSWVVLTGNIVFSLPKPHDYTFRDSSGEITVDIGPKEWRGLSVGVSDRVEISGEVKRERGQFFIKVHAIRKI